MMVYNKGLRRLVVVAMVVAANLIVGFTSGEGPLAFEDDRPLTLTWKEVMSGVDVVVCNVGSEDLQSLQATLTGFKFQLSAQPIADSDVLELSDFPSVLNAGECTKVQIKASDRCCTPDSGEYQGLLVVSGLGAGMIRRNVNISVPKPDAKPAAKESAVGEEVVVNATLTENVVRFDVPLKAEADKEALDVPKTGACIGIVYSEGRLGRVYVDGDPEDPKEGVLLLPVRVEGLEVPGTYKGTVSVTGEDTEAIKLTVNVKEAAGPIVTDISVSGTRNPWRKSVSFEEGIQVKFHVPGEGQNPTFFETDTFVGAVSRPDQVLDVRITDCNDQPATDTDIETACLQIDGLNEPGEYKGKVDVTNNDSDGDFVNLTITVTDALIWAILASALGVILAALVAWITQGLRPWLGMKARARKLEKQVDKPSLACKTPPEHPYHITADFKTFRDEYNKYKRRLIWDTSSKEYQGLVEMLDSMAEAIKSYCEDFGPRLTKLQAKLKAFRRFLEKEPLVKYVEETHPTLVKVVAAQLSPTNDKKGIPIDKVQVRLDYWKGLSGVIDQWMNMAAVIYRYDKWITNLRELSLLGEDRVEVNYVEARLREAAHEMYEATSAADLEAMRTKQELDTVYHTLARLSGKYEDEDTKVWVKPQRPSDIPVVTLAKVEERESLQEYIIEVLRGFDFDIGEAIEEAPPRLLIRARWGLDLALLGFALTVAVFAGLQAKYFGQTFGMSTDYLEMLLLGGGAGALGAGLVAIVGRLFQQQ